MMYMPQCNAAVNDMAALRLQNLKSLKKTPTDLVQACGSSPSQWSDLLNGRKSFGEKLARRIEDGLVLPRTWLDQPHGRKEAAEQAAKEAPPAPIAAALEALARAIAGLPKLDRRQLATLLPLLAEEPETRQATCKAIMKWLEPATDYEYKSTWEEAAEEVARVLGPKKKFTAPQIVAWVDEARTKPLQLVAVAATVKTTRAGT